MSTRHKDLTSEKRPHVKKTSHLPGEESSDNETLAASTEDKIDDPPQPPSYMTYKRPRLNIENTNVHQTNPANSGRGAGRGTQLTIVRGSGRGLQLSKPVVVGRGTNMRSTPNVPKQQESVSLTDGPWRQDHVPEVVHELNELPEQTGTDQNKPGPSRNQRLASGINNVNEVRIMPANNTLPQRTKNDDVQNLFDDPEINMIINHDGDLSDEKGILLTLLRLMKTMIGDFSLRLTTIEERLESIAVQIRQVNVPQVQQELEETKMLEELFAFPVDSNLDLTRLEEELKNNFQFKKFLVQYMKDHSNLPSFSNMATASKVSTFNKAVNQMMVSIMTNELAVSFNKKGLNLKKNANDDGKTGFEEKHPAIIHAVLDAMQFKLKAINGPPTDAIQVGNSIGDWLRLAATRTEEGKKKRREAARIQREAAARAGRGDDPQAEEQDQII